MIGITGWIIFEFLKFPVPPLLGPLTVTIIFKLAEIPLPDIPGFLYPALQIILGMYIGSRINRETFRQIFQFAAPFVVVFLWVIAITVSLGALLQFSLGSDFYTSLLAVAPGGIADMGVVALAVDADLTTVMLFQISRLFFVLIIVSMFFKSGERGDEGRLSEDLNEKPWIIKIFLNRVNVLRNIWSSLFRTVKSPVNTGNLRRMFPCIVVGLFGGWLGHLSGIPAGTLFFSIIAVGLVNVRMGNMFPPPPFSRKFVQGGVGIVTGHRFSTEILGELFNFTGIVLLVLVIVIVSAILVAYIIRHFTGWDLALCFLCAAPASLVTMVTLAEQFEKDSLKVGVLHLSRILTIKAVLFIILVFF